MLDTIAIALDALGLPPLNTEASIIAIIATGVLVGSLASWLVRGVAGQIENLIWQVRSWLQ